MELIRAPLSGAPALDAQGRVVGVTIAESPRRGRIYTTAPEVVNATLSAYNARPTAPAAGESARRLADKSRTESGNADVNSPPRPAVPLHERLSRVACIQLFSARCIHVTVR